MCLTSYFGHPSDLPEESEEVISVFCEPLLGQQVPLSLVTYLEELLSVVRTDLWLEFRKKLKRRNVICVGHAKTTNLTREKKHIPVLCP